jgi:UPF0042 nucleotide-binding protein
MRAVRVISFGFGHGAPPDADILLDVRESLHNPADDPALQELTGLDERVRAHVLDTPGAVSLVTNVVAAALTLASDQPNPVIVAWGCSWGRQSSVALADETERRLWRSSADLVYISHRDMDKSLLAPTAGRHSHG